MSGTLSIDTTVASRVATLLIARKQTLAVSESSAGGLIAASLLSVPGASAYFLGGGVIYTGTAREALLGVSPATLGTIRSATEEIARLLAKTVRTRLGADWGLAETGATGPSGNRYGDAAGHCCLAVAGPACGATEDFLKDPGITSRVLATGQSDRAANMVAFANSALALLETVLTESA